MAWTVGPPTTYLDEEKKSGFDIVCDQDIAVVGLTGYSGKARVYDLQTGEVRHSLKCNQMDEDDPEDDAIHVAMGTDFIVTLADNRNTLTIWDKTTGEMLARDLHKDEEGIEESIEAMQDDKWLEEMPAGLDEQEEAAYISEFLEKNFPNQREIKDMCVKDDLIYAGYGFFEGFDGYDGGFLIIGKQDGDWKIIEDNKLGYAVRDVILAGKLIAIGKEEGKDKKILSFWDPEKREMINEMEMEFPIPMWWCRIVYPHIFFIPIQRGNVFDEIQTGVEIWNLETKEQVRHLLKDYKKYNYISTNGKFLAICELLDSFCSGEEKDVELAVFNVDQLVDKNIAEEDLWRFRKEYKLHWLTPTRAAFNEDQLIVSHSCQTLDIHALG